MDEKEEPGGQDQEEGEEEEGCWAEEEPSPQALSREEPLEEEGREGPSQEEKGDQASPEEWSPVGAGPPEVDAPDQEEERYPRGEPLRSRKRRAREPGRPTPPEGGVEGEIAAKARRGSAGNPSPCPSWPRGRERLPELLLPGGRGGRGGHQAQGLS